MSSQGGYFASRSPYDVAWSDVVITLFTPVGGRVGNRGFGSGLPSLIFDPIDATLPSMARLMAQQALAEHCPHVNLINLQMKGSGAHQVQVIITFCLASDANTPITKMLRLDRRNITQFIAASNS